MEFATKQTDEVKSYQNLLRIVGGFMITNIKLLIKKNKFFESIIRVCFIPYFYAKWCDCIYKEHQRKIHKEFEQPYASMKKFKNIHLGKRCFIVGSGPSLNIEDLNMLKNEISFGMNSGILAVKESTWEPTYYGIQDEYVYKRLENEINKMSSSGVEIFISDSVHKVFDFHGNHNIFALNYLDHKIPHLNGFGKFRCSDDCYVTVYDGYSITYSLMQIAIYMGFSEIYLLGCDCNYRQEKKHFMGYQLYDPKIGIMGDKMIVAHKKIKEFADKKGIKIINCTRGGMLEVYPRMNLEGIIKNK